jgi:hypothetical protein
MGNTFSKMCSYKNGGKKRGGILTTISRYTVVHSDVRRINDNVEDVYFHENLGEEYERTRKRKRLIYYNHMI